MPRTQYEPKPISRKTSLTETPKSSMEISWMEISMETKKHQFQESSSIFSGQKYFDPLSDPLSDPFKHPDLDKK